MIDFNGKKKIIFVLLILVFLSFVASLTVFLVKKGGTRRTFVFPSVEKEQYIVETRRLPKSAVSPVEYYVNELMLGPQTERCRRIFTKETKILSIYVKDKVLYVNFSKDIINPETEGKMLPLRQSMELLRTNVLRNFRNIYAVEIFVEGNPAYENN